MNFIKSTTLQFHPGSTVPISHDRSPDIHDIAYPVLANGQLFLQEQLSDHPSLRNISHSVPAAVEIGHLKQVLQCKPSSVLL